MLKVGTLFSGIGAFEHALHQLGIEYQIQFACDNGERELPLTYGNLRHLTAGMTPQQLHDYCEKYINSIGIKREFRDVELTHMLIHANNADAEDNAPIVVSYEKEGRKSPVKHKLILTQEQIIALTPNMTMRQREEYVNVLYDDMGGA